MTREVSRAIEGAKGEQKQQEISRLRRTIERFASTPPGNRGFDGTQIKNEGRFHIGNNQSKTVAVLAVKAYQSRLYGCCEGKSRRFIITECDLGKKQTKANPSKLRAAAKKYGAIIDEER